jgi:hypothetical protein
MITLMHRGPRVTTARSPRRRREERAYRGYLTDEQRLCPGVPNPAPALGRPRDASAAECQRNDEMGHQVHQILPFPTWSLRRAEDRGCSASRTQSHIRHLTFARACTVKSLCSTECMESQPRGGTASGDDRGVFVVFTTEQPAQARYLYLADTFRCAFDGKGFSRSSAAATLPLTMPSSNLSASIGNSVTGCQRTSGLGRRRNR